VEVEEAADVERGVFHLAPSVSERLKPPS
jgi:hypothetical protein